MNTFPVKESLLQGIDVEEIIDGFTKDNRFGFEEVTYLLLFGELPNEEQLESFINSWNSIASCLQALSGT